MFTLSPDVELHLVFIGMIFVFGLIGWGGYKLYGSPAQVATDEKPNEKGGAE